MKPDFTNWISSTAKNMRIRHKMMKESIEENDETKSADESVGSAIDGMSVKQLMKELQAKLREEYTTDCEIVIAPANGVPQKIVSVDSIVDPEEDDIAIVINTEDSPESATRFMDFDESEDGKDDED